MVFFSGSETLLEEVSVRTVLGCLQRNGVSNFKRSSSTHSSPENVSTSTKTKDGKLIDIRNVLIHRHHLYNVGRQLVKNHSFS